MNTRIEKLTAKVAAVNRAGVESAKLYPILVETFTPFLGQKIEKVDGSFLSKVEKVIPLLSRTPQLHIFRRRSDYSLAYTVKTCEPMPPNSCMYHEVTVPVGQMLNGVLVKMCPPEDYRSDYTVEEIVSKRDALKVAEQALNDAKSALFPFEEYDN